MIIETKRLILRPFLEGDATDVYEYLKEPAVNCFAGMKLHSLEEAREEMKKRLGETEYYFAITLKDGGKVIGEIDAYPEAGEPHAGEDAPRDTFSPCWMLNGAYQGKGYAFPFPRIRNGNKCPALYILAPHRLPIHLPQLIQRQGLAGLGDGNFQIF